MRNRRPMAKVTIHIPSVSWRGGRPRFTPGPETRKKFGIKGQDLKHPDGRWFTAEEALAWVEQMKADLAGAAAKARPKQALAKARVGAGPSLYTLSEDYFRSPVVTGGKAGKRETKAKSPHTIAAYRSGLKRIEDTDADLFHGPAASLTTPICRGLYERMWEERGMSAARSSIAALSVVLSWAIRAGKVRGLMVNPAKDLGMATPPPRLRAGTPAEIRQLVAAADLAVYPSQHKGHHELVARPEVCDMVILGVWTGQRQADRLTMTAEHLARGRLVQRQQKTMARVDFPQGPELVARLRAIKARRLDWDKKPDELIANSLTKLPFAGRTTYAHLFEAVRTVAAAGVWQDRTGKLHVAKGEREAIEARRDFADWRLPPMPSVADLRDQDLRDTCVTWLASAGNDPIRIAAVTGHSLKTIHDILKHYLEAHPDYGDQAIAALVEWFDLQTG